MTKKEKLDALLETAYAYYRRGAAIQYHQLSLDRVVRVTLRRKRGMPPEASTKQRMQFLDCSTFCWSVYHETFGLDMPADLTWEMCEIVKPRMYSYAFTHEEDMAARAAIEADIRATLEAGDVMVYARTSGSGHAMLYIGDGKFMHCTAKAGEGDYDYKEWRNRFSPRGALYIDDLSLLFTVPDGTPATKRSLFNDNVRCFVILRPMDAAETLTENMKKRMKGCRKLDMAVLSSVSGGHTAEAGDEICYTLEVKNAGEEARDLAVSFTAPAGTKLLGEGRAKAELPAKAGAVQSFAFTVKLGKTTGTVLPAPKIKVNGFAVDAPEVLLGHKPSAEEEKAVIKAFRKAFAAGKDAYAAAAEAYAAVGLPLPQADIFSCLSSHFRRSDALSGNVLYRDGQAPAADMAAYSLFGGAGVITPETGHDRNIRTFLITRQDLMPGDLILAADDSLLQKTYAAFYDGKKLCGQFAADGELLSLTGKAADSYIDSLFGRYAFLVLRPFLAAGKP